MPCRHHVLLLPAGSHWRGMPPGLCSASTLPPSPHPACGFACRRGAVLNSPKPKSLTWPRPQDFSPCELFQRIRGRTLWLLGDSQTWHFYYALECFLREFAPSLRRTWVPCRRPASRPLPRLCLPALRLPRGGARCPLASLPARPPPSRPCDQAACLRTLPSPPRRDPLPSRRLVDLLTLAELKRCYKPYPVPPVCLELAQGTRVCVVRGGLCPGAAGGGAAHPAPALPRLPARPGGHECGVRATGGEAACTRAAASSGRAARGPAALRCSGAAPACAPAGVWCGPPVPTAVLLAKAHPTRLPGPASGARARPLFPLTCRLHYYEDVMCTDDDCQVLGPDSKYVRELRRLARWRARNRASLPQTVWMDTPPQHFPGTGYWTGSFRAKSCEPLAAWQRGEATARAGGTWNAAAARLVPRLADAHLATWEASVGLWDSHMPGECTHWCQPGAYQIWLYLLNGVLRDHALGNPAAVQQQRQRQ